jgi:16S rRNA (guanine527-N7)-methyltransferase
MSDHIGGVPVSRETYDRMQAYADLLRKWNARINLVSPASIPDLWDRHIADSAQLFPLAPPARTWVDLGSGGGLPGLVCAILAQQHHPQTRFVLIESDKRKCAFLQSAAHALALPVQVLPQRAEQAPPQGADVVTARAMAPLVALLPHVARHVSPTGCAILPKGRNHAQELEAARAEWHFDCTAQPSVTDPDARCLIIRNLTRG